MRVLDSRASMLALRVHPVGWAAAASLLAALGCEPNPPPRAAPPVPAEPAAARPVGPASHCTDGENVVWSCAIGDEIVSICASKQLAERYGYLQFRYGRPGAPLVLHPKTLADTQRAFALRRKAGPVEHLSLAFGSGGQRYTVRDERGQEGKERRSAGLTIVDAEGAMIMLDCDSALTGSLAALEGIVPPASP